MLLNPILPSRPPGTLVASLVGGLLIGGHRDARRVRLGDRAGAGAPPDRVTDADRRRRADRPRNRYPLIGLPRMLRRRRAEENPGSYGNFFTRAGKLCNNTRAGKGTGRDGAAR